MKRIVVSTFVTLDGVMEAPEKWSFDFQSEDTLKSSLELLFASDGLLLGRRTYEAFAGSWPDREDPMGFAEKMNSMPKHVVSTTLADAAWGPAEIISADIVERVQSLKADGDGQLLMYGSATLMRSLMEHDLIDEYRFLLSPIVVGSGARLFPEGLPRMALKTEDATPLSGGMTVLRYHRAETAARA